MTAHIIKEKETVRVTLGRQNVSSVNQPVHGSNCDHYLQILVWSPEWLLEGDHDVFRSHQLWGHKVHCLAVRIVEYEETTFEQATSAKMTHSNVVSWQSNLLFVCGAWLQGVILDICWCWDNTKNNCVAVIVYVSYQLSASVWVCVLESLDVTKTYSLCNWPLGR